VKVTAMLQVEPTARTWPLHVLLVIAKSPGLAPPSVTLVTVRAALPVLVTVMLWGALAVPSTSFPKLTLAGETEAAGAGEVGAAARLNCVPAEIHVSLGSPVTWTADGLHWYPNGPHDEVPPFEPT